MAVRKVPLSAQKCINVFFFLILEFDLIIARLILNHLTCTKKIMHLNLSVVFNVYSVVYKMKVKALQNKQSSVAAVSKHLPANIV